MALMKNGKIPTLSIEQVQANYVKVVRILEIFTSILVSQVKAKFGYIAFMPITLG